MVLDSEWHSSIDRPEINIMTWVMFVTFSDVSKWPPRARTWSCSDQTGTEGNQVKSMSKLIFYAAGWIYKE